MHGNVSEWVDDRYRNDYADSPKLLSVFDQSFRVVRGGSWADLPVVLRSRHRNLSEPASRSDTRGFRVARTL